jgi:hypothetical protein
MDFEFQVTARYGNWHLHWMLLYLLVQADCIQCTRKGNKVDMAFEEITDDTISLIGAGLERFMTQWPLAIWGQVPNSTELMAIGRFLNSLQLDGVPQVIIEVVEHREKATMDTWRQHVEAVSSFLNLAAPAEIA